MIEAGVLEAGTRMAGRFDRGFRIVSRLVCGVAVFAASAACKKTPEPPAAESSPSAVPAPPPATNREPAPQPAASALPPVEITWVDPPGLRRVPPKSPMRKASFEVPHAKEDKEDGELAVFYFGPGQGGSIDANVDRWVKQFSGVASGDVK